jgi:hypothetical protein
MPSEISTRGQRRLRILAGGAGSKRCVVEKWPLIFAAYDRKMATN